MKAPKEVTPEWIRQKFTEVTMSSHDQRWRVGGMGGRMSGQVGKLLATVGLRHSPGYEVVLQFKDGTIDSFAPHNLSPFIPEKNEQSQ